GMCEPRAKKKRRSYKWSQSAREMVKANLDASGRQLRALVSELVRATGYPRKACGRFARKVGVRAQRKHKRWPHSEQRRLLELLEIHAVAESSQNHAMHRRLHLWDASPFGSKRERDPGFLFQTHTGEALHTHTND